MALKSEKSGKIEIFEGHGAWVEEGIKVHELMETAKLLEQELDVASFVSRAIASKILKRLMTI